MIEAAGAAGPEHGYLYDGETAHRRPVTLELGGSALLLRFDDADMAATAWPYARMSRLESKRFACDIEPDKRLMVPSALLADTLAEQIARDRQPSSSGKRIAWIGAAVAAVVLFAVGVWQGGGTLLDLAAAAIPKSAEDRLGRSAQAQVGRMGTPCTGAAGQAAITRLAANLAAAAKAATPDVTVLTSKSVNAFALPGGRIVFLSGLIDRAGSADEVAGVLAHEMAHVELRHPTRLMLRYFGISMLASMMLGDSRITDAVGALGLLANSREFEAAADRRALELLQAAAINTGGLAAFFERMASKQGDSDPGLLRYFSTHPPDTERKAAAARAATTGRPAMSNEDWTALRGMCKQG